MAVTVAQVKAVLTAETSQFDKGIATSSKKVETFAKDTKKQIDAVRLSLLSMAQTMTQGVASALTTLGRSAVDAAIKMDSLKRGLVTVTGSAQEAEKQLIRLREIAKLPGLSFEGAIQGSIRLQAAGLSAQKAEQSIRAFGNALASVGKGQAELDGVTLALSQISAKGKVSAEEINQIAERVPQIRKTMLEAFGTADTEILQKAKISSDEFLTIITNTLEKSTKVARGLRESFEENSESLKESLRRMGDAIAPLAEKVFTKVANEVEKLTKAFSELPKQTQDLIIVLGALTIAGGPLLTVTLQIIELGKAIGMARLAALGPIAGVAALIGVGAMAGLAVWNADSDKKIAAGASTARQDFQKQLTDLKAQRDRILGATTVRDGKPTNSRIAADVAGVEAQIKDMERRVKMATEAENRVTLAAQKAAADNLRKQQAAADKLAADAKKKIQDAINEKARKEAEAAFKKAQAEAERLRNLNAGILDEYRALIDERYEYERFKAKQEYDEQLRDGANRVTAYRLYLARLKNATIEMIADVESRIKQSEFPIPGFMKANRPGAPLTGGGPAGDVSIEIPDSPFIQRDTQLGRPNRRTAIITEKDVNAQNAAIEAFQRDLLRSARRSSRNFLSALLGGERDRNFAFKNLVEDLKKNLIDGLVNSAIDFGPMMERLTTTMRDGMIEAVNATLRVAQSGIGQILGAVYQLLSGLNRKGGLNFGNILGAAAGFALGGPAGAAFGFNAGGALASGDIGGALGAAAVYGANGGFGAVGPIGGGNPGGAYGPNPAGYGPWQSGASRSAQVHYSGPIYVNERADIERLGRETVRRMDLALAAGAV